MWAHLDAPPPSVLARGVELPPATDDVIRRGMAKDPDERFQSAGDLAQAALAALDDRPPARGERTVAIGDAAPGRREGTILDDVPPAVPRRSRRAALIALGLAVVAAAVVAAVALDGGGGGDAPPPSSAVLAQSWSAPVGGYPLYAAVAGGQAWVTLDGADRLKRVALDGGSVRDTPVLGDYLGGLAVAGDRLLVGAFGEDLDDGRGTVVTVDPATGEAVGAAIRTIEPFELATDGRTLWVTDTEQLDVIDLPTRRRARRIDLVGAFDVAVEDGTAWVVNVERGELQPFVARTGTRRGRAIDVGARPVSVAATADAVWVATEQGQLLRVTPDGGRPEALAVGGEGNRMVEADADGVWVVDEQGNVVLVDPERLAVRARLRIGDTLPDVALDGGAAFVIRARSSAESTLVRVSSARAGQ
jgi:hypothetical protein